VCRRFVVFELASEQPTPRRQFGPVVRGVPAGDAGAGTLGSETYGVAKNVRLHAVKMLNCAGGGQTSATLMAIDWVTANAQKPAVANTSWNWTYSDTLAAADRDDELGCLPRRIRRQHGRLLV
jgi:hypothetical protein